MFRRLSHMLVTRSVCVYLLMLMAFRSCANEDLMVAQRAKYLLGIFYNEGLENYQDGIVYAHYMIRQNPEDAQSHFVLGYCHFMMGDYAAAVSWLERAYQINPDGDQYKTYLTQTYMKLGREAGIDMRLMQLRGR